MLKKIAIFSTLFSFFAGQLAYAAAPQLNITGQVQGAGAASMKTTSGWINVSGKSYPVPGGSSLVTGSNGEMTVELKNGVRMEMGKNSEVTISGPDGNYSVWMQRGTLAYYVPQSVQLAIGTSNSRIIANAFSKGFVGQGKDTYIKCMEGKIAVSGASEHCSAVVKPGETLIVTQAAGRCDLAQVSYDEAAIEAAIEANPAPAADAVAGITAIDAETGNGHSRRHNSTIWLIIGGVAAAGAVGGAMGGGHGGGSGDPGSSSPY